MASKRVLVVFERGRGGATALEHAGRAARDEAELTVVCIANQAASGARCGNSALAYNEALVDAAAADLRQAQQRLGEVAQRTAFEVLVEGADPPPEQWIASGGFDVILLPAHWRPLRAPTHPLAARLRGSTGAEVRIVDSGRGAPVL
jgi:hypothetical protein